MVLTEILHKGKKKSKKNWEVFFKGKKNQFFRANILIVSILIPLIRFGKKSKITVTKLILADYLLKEGKGIRNKIKSRPWVWP